MILMDRIGVRDVPLKDYIFSNSCFHNILIFKVTADQLLLMHLAKAQQQVGEVFLPWDILLTADLIKNYRGDSGGGATPPQL